MIVTLGAKPSIAMSMEIDRRSQPVLTRVRINGGEAILSLKPLPSSSIDQQQTINDILKTSRLQIKLVEGS